MNNKRWLSLPKLQDVRLIYADDWYDYFLSGVVEYQGKRYYAVFVDENHTKKGSWYRRYLVVDLPDEVWEKENERHAYFVDKVGGHFEFDENEHRKINTLKDSRTWNEFYEKYPVNREPRNYEQYPHIGWFEK